MNIYPYVYKLVHKSTGQFYIGYRCANKVPAEQDIGHRYFSSSKVIESIGFENFDCFVIAEFFNKQHALEFECELIQDAWEDDLLLNLSFQEKNFSMTKHSEEAKKKIAAALLGKKHPPERVAKNGSRKGAKFTDEQRAHLSIMSRGVPKSAEHRAAISASHKGTKKPWASELAKRNSAARVGTKHSPETIQKMRAAHAARRALLLTS